MLDGKFVFFFLIKRTNAAWQPLPLIPSAPVELLNSSVIQLPGERSVCDRVNVKQGDAETKQQSLCAHGSVDPSGTDKSNAPPGPPPPKKRKIEERKELTFSCTNTNTTVNLEDKWVSFFTRKWKTVQRRTYWQDVFRTATLKWNDFERCMNGSQSDTWQQLDNTSEAASDKTSLLCAAATALLAWKPKGPF